MFNFYLSRLRRRAAAAEKYQINFFNAKLNPDWIKVGTNLPEITQLQTIRAGEQTGVSFRVRASGRASCSIFSVVSRRFFPSALVIAKVALPVIILSSSSPAPHAGPAGFVGHQHTHGVAHRRCFLFPASSL